MHVVELPKNLSEKTPIDLMTYVHYHFKHSLIIGAPHQ